VVIGGVANYLEHASSGNVNLFISRPETGSIGRKRERERWSSRESHCDTRFSPKQHLLTAFRSLLRNTVA
jgi:hypothetical protein